ncbi:MAG: carboxypeptidase-like regulatory domain-containing protein [Anaerolineales bacterium]|nr:carboxypeptidase-like regulatory domain-containing protein [Anaerolineales bacterium]
MPRILLIPILAVFATACDLAQSTRFLEIEATGTLSGVVYFDGNGNRAADSSDRLLEDIGVRLVVEGTGDTTRSATTDVQGRYAIPSAPLGTYRLVVDPQDLGDTIDVVAARVGGRTVPADSPVTFTLGAGDSLFITVGLSYPAFEVAELRDRPVAEKAFVEGIALTPRSVFGDTTLHLADTTGAIRATRVKASRFFGISPGDSLRLLGRRSVRDGQPTLDDVSWFVLGTTAAPPPDSLSTAAAATAVDGDLDAALVRVSGAIVDTTTMESDFVLRVDDGSGPVDVVLDADVAFDRTGMLPDTVVNAVGVLVPVVTGESLWMLKPRFQLDLEIDG